MREKLVELERKATDYATDACIYTSDCKDCPVRKYGTKCRDYLKVDYLISHGVTIATDNNVGRKTKADRCVCCGAIIPEGSMVCTNCHGEKEGVTDG